MKTKCSSRMKALLLVLAMVLSMFCVSIGTAHPRFTDVPDSFWASKEIAWAVDKGVVNGTSATTFSPNAPCTRGQIVTFLQRSLNETAKETNNPFTDVAPNAFYANAVLWAVANDVTKGTSATTFSPNANCTRGQIVTFLYRAYL